MLRAQSGKKPPPHTHNHSNMSRRRSSVFDGSKIPTAAQFYSGKASKKDKLLVFLGFKTLDGVSHEVMHPDSAFQNAWGFFNLLFLCYIALVLPVKTAWESDIGCLWSLIYVDMVIDVFYVLDVVVNLSSGFRTIGRLETKFAPSFKHYLRSWFIFDIIVSIPTTFIQFFVTVNGEQLICSVSVNGVGSVKLLRMIRLVRVVRVVKMFKLPIFEKMKGNHFIFSLVKLMILVVFLMHLTACIWWFIKTFDPDLDIWQKRYALDGHPVVDKYICSLYFVAATLVTVGYGDIYAVNAWERGYCFVLMLVGAGVFATVISSISNLVDASSSRKKEHEEHILRLIEFFEFHQVRVPIQDKIKAFFRYNDEIDSYKINMNSLVQTLPGPLAEELRVQLARRVVGGNTGPLAEATDEYLSTMFPFLKALKLSPGEEVFFIGDRATALYFVYQGCVHLVLHDGTQIAVSAGSYNCFGENLLHSSKCEYSVMSPGYATVYYIERKDLVRINEDFSGMTRNIVEYARSCSTAQSTFFESSSRWLAMRTTSAEDIISVMDPDQAARKIQRWFATKKKEHLIKIGEEVDMRLLRLTSTYPTFGDFFLNILREARARGLVVRKSGDSSTDSSSVIEGSASGVGGAAIVVEGAAPAEIEMSILAPNLDGEEEGEGEGEDLASLVEIQFPSSERIFTENSPITELENANAELQAALERLKIVPLARTIDTLRINSDRSAQNLEETAMEVMAAAKKIESVLESMTFKTHSISTASTLPLNVRKKQDSLRREVELSMEPGHISESSRIAFF